MNKLKAFVFVDHLSFLLTVLSDSDDNEDVKVHRKLRRNAIKDSDTEEEEEASKTSDNTAEAMASASSGEEMATPENVARAAQKSKRIGRAPAESEESESEQAEGGRQEARKGPSPVRKENKREKSRRHREKKEKRSRVVEKLKKKERRSVSEPFLTSSSLFANPSVNLEKQSLFLLLFQSSPPLQVLNDSGCALADTDLFDTGLGDEEDEEESLEAIRAAIKQRMKNHKVLIFPVQH